MVRMASDLEKQLDEDTLLLTEMLKHWLSSCVSYLEWYTRACVDFSITAFDLLDPPAVVFRPDRKDQLSKIFDNVGRMFRCYDLIRTQRPPLPIGGSGLSLHIDVVQCKLWLKSCQWLDKVIATESATQR